MSIEDALLTADDIFHTLVYGKMYKAPEYDAYAMLKLLHIFLSDLNLPSADPPKTQPRKCQMPGCSELATAICTDMNGNSFSYCAKHAILANPFISEFRAAQGRYHD